MAALGDEQLINDRTAICVRCGPRLIEDFYAYRRPGYARQIQSWCKSCRKEYNRQHYKNNKEDYKRRGKASCKKLRDATQKKIMEYLTLHPCEVCGERDPVVLDFHHRDPLTKEFTIGQILGHGYQWERIFAEIKKCTVLCANDHRREHAKKKNSYRHQHSGRSG